MGIYLIGGLVNAFNNLYILVDTVTHTPSVEDSLNLISILGMLTFMLLWPVDLILKAVIMSSRVEKLDEEIRELESLIESV